MRNLLPILIDKLSILRKRYCYTLFVLLFFTSAAYGQTTVSGKVIDEYSEPLIGASVSVQGTTDGTVTDVDGAFRFTTSKASPITLKVSYVGYAEQAVAYSGRSVQIVLKENVEALDEVVVTAGGIFRSRREQGYTATRVTAEELTASKPTSVGAGLTGKVAGLQINAISSGVNPMFRLVLRGNRSLTGNNTALVVVDNTVVNSDLLGSINPEDIEDIQVLTGAAGATLYGAEASNGVLLITTKKGKVGKPEIKVSHSLNLENVSFFPKLQSRFGQGATNDGQHYDKVENQQYGPVFDGSLRELGYPLEDGSQQYTTYDVKNGNGRNDFWETGTQNKTDISLSFGTEKSTSFISAQYLSGTSTTPGDKYSRVSIRLNNTIKPLKGLDINYTASYTENNYDITYATSDVYNRLTQISANIPVTDYKDYENNIWATRGGWYNPWYPNPYWTAANFRRDQKDAYMTGRIEAKYQITPWMYALYRIGLSSNNMELKDKGAKLTLSDYYLQEHGKGNNAGHVEDRMDRKSKLNQDIHLGFTHKVWEDKLNLNLILGASNSFNSTKYVRMYADGLVVPGMFNISNRSIDAVLKEENTAYRSYGIWGDFVAGYQNYLFLHVTGRNDWTSLLAKENRSYFYPSADISFVPTDAFVSLKEGSVLDFMKLRFALSQTGNVNIKPYQLDPTFDSVTGYSTGTFYSKSDRLISESLQPEITKGWEIGTDFRLFNERIDGQINYYRTSTTGQAIYASVSRSSGFNRYLINVGEVTNAGIEANIHVTPIRTKDWQVTVGGNYTYNKNLLKDMPEGMETVGIRTNTDDLGTTEYIFAIKDMEVNQIVAVDYNRVEEGPYKGRVIINPVTGYPSLSSSKPMGNTTPKHRLGVDLKVRWKDFMLTTLFEYRGDYYAIAYDLGRGLDFSGASARTAYYNRDRFVFPESVYEDPNNPGSYIENTDITVADGGAGFWTGANYNRGAYSNYVYRADYWKWREIALVYTLPRSVVGKIPGIAGASVAIQGRNLFLWTSKANEYTDPDYSQTRSADDNEMGISTLRNTPPTRTFGGTISLTF
jgi:TonB-linked SusC/RagA family outer membrane protein